MGFVLSILEFCPAVWRSAAPHLKVLDRLVSGACLLSGVFQCNIALHQSLAVLFMLILMHPLYGVLPIMYYGAISFHYYRIKNVGSLCYFYFTLKKCFIYFRYFLFLNEKHTKIQ